MAQLLLAKHSSPEITAAVSSHRWVLSEEGRAGVRWLADEWRERRVRALYASLEPKALETAALVAVELGLGVIPRRGLQENDRSGLGHIPAADLRQRIARFFDAPDEAVIGDETAASALARFERAVRRIAADGEAIAGVIAHGTVISLLVSAHNDVRPMELWARLQTPSYVTLDASDLSWDGVVRRPTG